MFLRRLHRPVYLAYLRLSIRPFPNLPSPSSAHSKSKTIHTNFTPGHSLRPLQSNSSVVTTVIVATLLIAGGSYYVQRPLSEKTSLQSTAGPDERIKAKDLEDMPGAVLPGRPGNLTSEQEAKLKELWTTVFRVFGLDHSANGSDNAEEADQRSQREGKGLDKKKKSRVSLFGKKHKNDEGDGSVLDSSVASNDKWGQTKEFHNVLANQSPEDLRRAYWSMVKHDNPDALLLRFLRARKWDVQNALIMMVATMHWRLQEMHVDDDIMRRGEGGALEDSRSPSASLKKEGLDFLTQERMGKSFLHGTDKEGRPMCFVRARLHKQGEQSEPSLERYTVFLIETARLMLAPPVDTAVRLHDLQD